MKTKAEVTGKNSEDKEVTLIIKKPNSLQLKAAQLEKAKAFSAATKEKLMLKSNVRNYLKEQGMWNDVDDKVFKETGERLEKNRITLEKGGIKLSEAKVIAIQMVDDRTDQARLLFKLQAFDEFTAEGMAQSAYMDSLRIGCILNSDSTQHFSSLEDLRSKESSDVGVKAISELESIVYEYDPNWENKLPENKFLKDHKFVDENYKFIDKNGYFIDRSGNRVDEDGYRINESGERVDTYGNLLDKEGNLAVATLPFEDDVFDKVEPTVEHSETVSETEALVAENS